MPNETFLCIPAYNEEATLENLLKQLVALRKTRLFDRIIVGNDGSTDNNTLAIARRYADEVLDLPHRGKAHVFFDLAKTCYERNAEKMILLDADLKSVSEKQLRDLVAPLGKQKFSHYIVAMSVGQRKGDTTNWTGERAFLVKSFRTLLSSRKKQNLLLGVGGYGLEIFLNVYYTGRRRLDDPRCRPCFEVSNAVFEAGPITSSTRPGRTAEDALRLHAETDRMTTLFREREALAEACKRDRYNKVIAEMEKRSRQKLARMRANAKKRGKRRT